MVMSTGIITTTSTTTMAPITTTMAMHAHRDNNMRAAFIHVLADAAVSVLAIVGLLAGKLLGWNFMDPVMGIVGMLVIANWSFGLVRDTGSILLDMTPDRQMAASIRLEIEADGDRLADLHLWRLGPGHLARSCRWRQRAPGTSRSTRRGLRPRRALACDHRGAARRREPQMTKDLAGPFCTTTKASSMWCQISGI
ncbi:MAG: cation diffusion facilitator family transporter [Aliidongia sp.]